MKKEVTEIERMQELRKQERRDILSKNESMTVRTGLVFTWVKQGDIDVKEFRQLINEEMIHAEVKVKRSTEKASSEESIEPGEFQQLNGPNFSELEISQDQPAIQSKGRKRR